MTVYELITELNRAGIKVWVEQNQLKIKAPKGALTPELKSILKEKKAELIQFLPGQNTTKQQQEPIAVVSREGDLDLSYAQKRMWFLAQLEPDNAAYHIRCALELKGSLNVEALERALITLSERHESLRTTFISSNGVPKQKIGSEPLISFKVETYNNANADNISDDVLEQQFHNFVSQPFDLTAGPLFRAQLVQRADQHYVLMVAMHHIISDGWSIGIIVKELTQLYAAYASGQAATLPLPSIQYVDFSAWQKTFLSGDREASQLNYWHQQLENVPVLELPTDHSRPTVKTPAGGVVKFSVDSHLVTQAKTLAQKNSATLFMVLLSAFDALLYRYTGQTDFSVGTPIANRTHSQLEDIIGLFVNTLAIRARLTSDITFSELLTQIQSSTMDAYEHQDIPFERIVDDLGVSRDMSHTPVFQVMFVMQNIPGDTTVKLPGVVAKDLRLDRDSSPLDLTMTLTEEK